MARLFLGVVGLIFVAYGIACALDPVLPARLAGVVITSGDGYAEMSAMYGGLQIGVGSFCLLGAVREGLRQPALLLLVLSIGLLAALRGVGVLRTDEVVSVYSWGALGFESGVTLLAAILLRR
jgi:hypothetical protein